MKKTEFFNQFEELIRRVFREELTKALNQSKVSKIINAESKLVPPINSAPKLQPTISNKPEGILGLLENIIPNPELEETSNPDLLSDTQIAALVSQSKKLKTNQEEF